MTAYTTPFIFFVVVFIFSVVFFRYRYHRLESGHGAWERNAIREETKSGVKGWREAVVTGLVLPETIRILR